jgi:hypothetical protein
MFRFNLTNSLTDTVLFSVFVFCRDSWPHDAQTKMAA